MRVFLYSELQRQIEKSGVGRAILHQRKALEANGVIVSLQTSFRGRSAVKLHFAAGTDAVQTYSAYNSS